MATYPVEPPARRRVRYRRVALAIVCGGVAAGVLAVVLVPSFDSARSKARTSVPPAAVTFRGIAGVDLGMSVAEVRQSWRGRVTVAPQRAGRNANVFALICLGSLHGWGRFRGVYDKTLLHGGAKLVELTLLGEVRTLRGVRIGSTRADVTRAYRGLLSRPTRSTALVRSSGPNFERQGHDSRKTITFRFRAGLVSAIQYGWRGTSNDRNDNGARLLHDRHGYGLTFPTLSGIKLLRC